MCNEECVKLWSVIAAVIIQCYIFIVMIIIGIIVIITTTRLIEFGTEDLAEGKQCCNRTMKEINPRLVKEHIKQIPLKISISNVKVIL